MRFLLLPFLILISACATTPTEFELPRYITVSSSPSQALLSFPDGSNCETPCTVELVEYTMPMHIAKAGYKKIDFTLTTTTPTRLHFDLELAAVSVDVETDILPEL